MRLRNVKNADYIVRSSPYVVMDAGMYKGSFASKVFKNDNPIHLEIGMGKGKFIIEMARKFPDVNFIGIERYESVLCRAIEKLDGVRLSNLRFICMDAIRVGEVFDKEISTIYLNFSDPWPKKRHSKRRLTSSVFLSVYDSIFEGEKVIVQKTDNVLLFESSIVSLSEYGYVISEISLDLASSGIDNCCTEYEEKFMSQGVKINYLKAIKGEDGKKRAKRYNVKNCN